LRVGQLTQQEKTTVPPETNNRILNRARARARRNQVDPPMADEIRIAVFIGVGIIIAALALLSVIGEVVVGMS
jgi:hypothetical protein